MKNQISKNQTPEKISPTNVSPADVEALKAKHPELFNALVVEAKKVAGTKAGKTVTAQKEIPGIYINKWGDVHFKSLHKASALEFAGIVPASKDGKTTGTPLKMTFSKGKIVLEAVEEKAQ